MLYHFFLFSSNCQQC
ncbi:hypothetical protein DPX39_010022800 [Trypanosoma brucei equiperdum]|uniref:Uncharacterized protein n=1 Tax=Trypanosoma brucei equiperdum TaxID=630700 RepID=A0A3L6LHR1_9TRYP|nr:hypothetical protein DPX39_010022800 [Trypanosoma brucei equiperdum]